MTRLDAAWAELVAAVREEFSAPSASVVADRLYGIREAAEQMAIGRTLLYTLIGRGEIRVLRVGRRVLVPAASIAEFTARAASSGESGTTARRPRVTGRRAALRSLGGGE